MSLDGNGRFSALDPREGAKLLVAECCRNLSTVGAQPVAATNNLNFGNPERPEIMAQLVETIEGIAEACAFFETPITGGNVSLYNETLGDAVFPSPVLGIVGLLETSDPVTIPFKNPGREILLIGGFGRPETARFGGTQYAKQVLNTMWGLPPALDMDYEKRVQAAVREIVRKGLAESAHDLSDGGLGIALAECTFDGTGASISIDWDVRPEFLLFDESPSRVLISTANSEEVKRIALFHGVESPRIGVTITGRLQISNNSAKLIDCSLDNLRRAWDQALPRSLHPEHA